MKHLLTLLAVTLASQTVAGEIEFDFNNMSNFQAINTGGIDGSLRLVMTAEHQLTNEMVTLGLQFDDDNNDQGFWQYEPTTLQHDWQNAGQQHYTAGMFFEVAMHNVNWNELQEELGDGYNAQQTIVYGINQAIAGKLNLDDY